MHMVVYWHTLYLKEYLKFYCPGSQRQKRALVFIEYFCTFSILYLCYLLHSNSNTSSGPCPHGLQMGLVSAYRHHGICLGVEFSTHVCSYIFVSSIRTFLSFLKPSFIFTFFAVYNIQNIVWCQQEEACTR